MSPARKSKALTNARAGYWIALAATAVLSPTVLLTSVNTVLGAFARLNAIELRLAQIDHEQEVRDREVAFRRAARDRNDDVQNARISALEHVGH